MWRTLFMASPHSTSGEERSQPLDELLNHPDLWRGRRQRSGLHHQPTGYGGLDAALHSGGWPLGGLIECGISHPGIGEIALLAPALRELTTSGGLQLWIDPPFDPYPPALLQMGLTLTELVIVKPTSPQEWLWCCEQALRSSATTAVLCWDRQWRLNYTALRKLQVAAGNHTALLCLYRDQHTLRQSTSPALLRLEATPVEVGLQLHICKQRGATAGHELTLPLPRATARRSASRLHTRVTSPPLQALRQLGQKLPPPGPRSGGGAFTPDSPLWPSPPRLPRKPS